MHWREAERRVNAVRVLGAEQPAAQALQLRMTLKCLHQRAAKAFALLARENNHIAKPCERRLVGDETREADELAGIITRHSAH